MLIKKHNLIGIVFVLLLLGACKNSNENDDYETIIDNLHPVKHEEEYFNNRGLELRFIGVERAADIDNMYYYFFIAKNTSHKPKVFYASKVGLKKTLLYYSIHANGFASHGYIGPTNNYFVIPSQSIDTINFSLFRDHSVKKYFSDGYIGFHDTAYIEYRARFKIVETSEGLQAVD